jgi:hypothetical protein
MELDWITVVGSSTKARKNGAEHVDKSDVIFTHTCSRLHVVVDTATQHDRRVHRLRLEHESGEAPKFYARLPGPARVGLEAAINAQRFERILHARHHERWSLLHA